MSLARKQQAFLRNASRNCVLAQEGKVLRGLATGIGAMFRGLPGSLVLVWPWTGRISLTNLFVPQDLDILWLDERCHVVDMHERFASWSWRTTNKQPARYVVELPAGTIARTRTARGDAIACRGSLR